MGRKTGHKGRTDKNQTAIVQALRQVGAKVQSIAEVGDGCPDLLVGFRGVWYPIEVKDKGGKLTDDEVRWWGEAERAGCEPIVKYTIEEILQLIGAIA